MSEENRPVPADDANADWDAIGRYLAGESDAVEAAAVEAWLAAHPGEAELVSLVNARAERLTQQADVAVDTEAALAAVRARIAADTPARPDLRVERGGAFHAASRTAAPRPAASAAPTRRWRMVGMAVAAGFAAVIAISQFRGRGETTPREFQTAVGQRDSLRLPDGSTVVLAPGSRLVLASSFDRGARDVTLEGAAFFEVVHDSTRPFTVHAGGADIRDIGTAFSVKTGRDGAVSVAVTHGIVSVGSAAGGVPGGATARAPSVAPVELHAGDRGVLLDGQVAVARGVVTDEDVAWTHGQLAYRDAPIGEVQADLQRWYGVDLQITDSALARRTLTASFKGDSAAQVLRLIALALGAEVVQRGDTVWLQPQSATPPATP
ncbi:FecR domain-containing protein [Gemmatimonas aurantiaca]|uniref:FecR family protein n=1 Tax=Gemmatimonas aurantiaca TaxID=173480 RepID=UPI00301C9620